MIGWTKQVQELLVKKQCVAYGEDSKQHPGKTVG